MSKATIQAIADAISAHMADVDEPGELSTFIVGYTFVTVEEFQGELDMHYTNSYTCSDGDPNTILGLTEVTLARVHDFCVEVEED